MRGVTVPAQSVKTIIVLIARTPTAQIPTATATIAVVMVSLTTRMTEALYQNLKTWVGI